MRHQKVTVIAFRKELPTGETPLYTANTVTEKPMHNKSIALIWPQNQQGYNNQSVLVVCVVKEFSKMLCKVFPASWPRHTESLYYKC